MFAYCGNNPVIHIDPSGTEYSLVGGGIQFEMDCGGYSVGIEIIVYWDVDECENGGFQVAVYGYGGTSVNTNDPFLASIMTAVMDNIEFFTTGCEDDILMMAAFLSKEFSISISGVAVFGDETFNSTRSYEGYFTSVSVSGGAVKGGYAYSENCFALSLGKTMVGSTLVPSICVSRTIYSMLFQFNTADILAEPTTCFVGG